MVKKKGVLSRFLTINEERNAGYVGPLFHERVDGATNNNAT
jgi:hypothetical protein